MFGELLDKYLKGKVSYQLPDGGLAFWLSMTEDTDLFKLKENAIKEGVSFTTPEGFSFDKVIPGIRIGYASLSEKEMEKGLKVVSKHL
ncbi:MAG: hypothetical protein LUH22_05765 [Bacteroides sp.]|nr:hypothetical protein [Bacteroides sp.]